MMSLLMDKLLGKRLDTINKLMFCTTININNEAESWYNKVESKLSNGILALSC